MENITHSVAALRANLARLPQALQSRIRADALTISPGITFIDHAYKPPVQLSINHDTRESAADIFYGSSQVFKFNGQIDDYLFTWLGSLPDQDLLRLQHSLVPDTSQVDQYEMWITSIKIRGLEYKVSLYFEFETAGVFVVRGLLLTRHDAAQTVANYRKVTTAAQQADPLRHCTQQ